MQSGVTPSCLENRGRAPVFFNSSEPRRDSSLLQRLLPSGGAALRVGTALGVGTALSRLTAAALTVALLSHRATVAFTRANWAHATASALARANRAQRATAVLTAALFGPGATSLSAASALASLAAGRVRRAAGKRRGRGCESSLHCGESRDDGPEPKDRTGKQFEQHGISLPEMSFGKSAMT